MKVVVTGGSGFLGRATALRLARSGAAVTLPLRRQAEQPRGLEGAQTPMIPAMEEMSAADWQPILAGADAVVHAAAIAHIGPSVPYSAYAAINRDAAARLAEAATLAGIKRFVFISSIRAQCGATSSDVQTERSPAQPTDAYGRTKLQAEELVRRAFPAATVLRPALIVGREARGNLAALARLARWPLPLPLGGLREPQAAISLDAVVSAIEMALGKETMRGETYLLADHPQPSLAAMVTAYRRGLGRGPGLFALPAPLLTFPLKLLGRGEAAARLTGGLKADAARLRAEGWKADPPVLAVMRAMGEAARKSR